MAKMKAAMAAVLVMEKEGVSTRPSACPVPRSTRCTPAAARAPGIAHILARHVEGASHMAEGYTRAKAGNIGVCIGTSGPAGTDMITGLYSARPTASPSCASPARRRAPACTRRTSRRSTSSPSPSR
jgi:tartronate-semialdehyde synthase